MMINTFLGMEIARRDASVFGAAHAERPQSYTEKTDCALQRRGNHCFRAGKPGKLTEKAGREVSRKVSEWKRPGFTRLAPNCMLRAAARRLGQGLWHSPCIELHITGGGSAMGASLVALALHRTACYRRRLGDGSKPCGAHLASNCMLRAAARRWGSKAFRIFAAVRQWKEGLWRSRCTVIPTSRREKVHRSAQVDLT